MTATACVLHALFVLLCLSHASSEFTLCNSEDPYLLSDTVNVLEGTVRALVRRVEYLNADAVIGLRLVADQLHAELTRLNSTDKVRDCGFVYPETSANLDISQLKSRLKQDHDAIEYFIPSALKGMSKNMQAYFYKDLVVPLTEVNKWNFTFPLITVDPSLLEQPDYSYDFQEEHSDDCIGQLTKASNENECNISEQCFWRMTLKNATSYWLTHELFFIFVAYNSPCFDKVLQLLRDLGRGSLQDFLTQVCTNVLRDAKLIAELGYPPNHQDLFIEQSTFCGLAGMKEFFRPDWIRLIYSWRRPDYCYEEVPGGNGRRRRKRYDVLTPDGCRVHKTVLAAMYATTLLRFLLH